jgi:hypothetical protein
MKRVAMPGQRLTGRQSLPAHECRATAKENLFGHFDLRRQLLSPDAAFNLYSYYCVRLRHNFSLRANSCAE